MLVSFLVKKVTLWNFEIVLELLIDRIECDCERQNAMSGDQHINAVLDPICLQWVDHWLTEVFIVYYKSLD